jgi:hypothetical protein
MPVEVTDYSLLQKPIQDQELTSLLVSGIMWNLSQSKAAEE